MQHNVCRIHDGVVGLDSYDHLVSVEPNFSFHLGCVAPDFCVGYGQGWEEVAINFSGQGRCQVHRKKF